MGEAVQAPGLDALEPRGGERLGGHLEGELGEDEHAQRAPRHVHAFPERIGAQENRRARFAEPPQQLVPLPLALHQQRPPASQLAAHRVRRAAQGPMAREQHEHAPVRRVGQLHHHAGDRGVVPGLVVARLREVGGNAEQTLRREVERGGVDLAHLEPARGEVETEPRFEVAEVAARGERGAREHHGLDPVEQTVLENRCEIERHGRERDVHDFSTTALEPAHRRGAPRWRPQRGDEPGRALLQPPRHAPQLAQELRPPLRRIVQREPVGDRPRAVGEAREGEQQVVERHVESLRPHGIVAKLIAQTQHWGCPRPRLTVQPAAEQGEHRLRGAARRRERVDEALLHQVAARPGEEVVAPEQHRAQRRQQSAAVLLEPPQQPLDAEPAHLGSQMHRGDVFQVVRLVQHQAAVRGQDGRFLPVVGYHAHREIGREQMVVHHHHIGFGRPPAGLEHEAAVEVRALEPRAQIRLRGDRVPHLATRLIGEIGERSVARARGPRRERFELHTALVLEQRGDLLARLFEAREAHVVPPPFEQRERGRVLAAPERAGQDRQVLADELLLQVDRIGRDDGALAVLARPHQRRHQVRERFSHARAGFEHPHAAVVVEVGDVGGHVALAGTVLEAAERARHRPAGREQPRHVDRIEAGGGPRAGTFDDDVAVADGVVHDREPHAAVVQPRGDAEIGARGLEHAARVVVEQQLAPHRDPRQGEHRVHRAARHDARLDDQAVGVGARDERHLAPVGRRDLGAQQVAHRRREPLHAHVFSSRFLAAGNRTLLRMSR